MDGVFALLDDRDASAEHPTSRLYTGFVREHRCSDPATLEAVCAALEADQRAGLHAVLLADYEWGAKLLGAGVRERDRDASLRVLMFERLERLARAQVDERLAMPADEPCGTLDLHASVTREEFTEAIARIHAAIADGETYQVNYTYRLTGRSYGDPLALYRALRTRQPVAYGAFVALPEGACVLSLSPELFVRHAGGLATARPMKGTAARITAPEGDSETARLLSLDVKNRAENLMIVDLLRNDLGRIAVTGSVTVPELFAIEPYATVFQMTSTVQAQLRPEVDLAALLRAVFPCGSITGAPKHHTMGLIAALESTPRGLYCGAIGWLDAAPPGRRLGDLCLSVAIRTLVLGAPQGDGTRPLRLGIGAGIVKDSVAADEYEECRLKARFLTGLDPGFELFETVLARGDGSLPYLERHLARLQRSAAALGFGFDRDAAREALHDAAGQGDGRPQRLRLALAKNGRLGLSRAPLAPLAEAVVDLLIAPQRLPDADPLAAHKTTRRAHYDAGVRAAEAAGAFDSLFLGADDRLVEGGRSSVFVRLDGRWWTPPLADGALPGVMRSVLLDDPAWQAAERRLDLRDLARAEALVVCNALRGVLPARLRQPAGALP
ncbi:MAG: aminodeoxychorismate synthase component I [Piscinibacter sp.]|uniref:aminodeoxychorismate synthase component I n=1 Tax=Piscinibacter sp. TaxID=1903157 RepID=UPI00258621FA|nr:aminodeoxychorismate synthase component I [Piscinibacter sp.]MCW5664435.1 aminodeoxychorismate synthase component I [Piscinibacter sp.]